MKIPYTNPDLGATAFNCPNCGAYASQVNQEAYVMHNGTHVRLSGWRATYCVHCKRRAVWHEEEIVHPSFEGGLPPNDDLNDEIKNDYEEARMIFQRSPRGAAALLRLAISKLCIQLGEKGENLNNDIKSLSQKGLSPLIAKSLDIVRVIGNNAVHPGELNVEDKIDDVSKMFALINSIADTMISQPKEIERLFGDLPESARKAIEKRDSKKS